MVKSVTPNKYLGDICIIRIILIFLLIIYHSLCPYTSDFWDNPQGYNIPVYYWIGRTSYSFMLETFVFISGVILGYQVLMKGTSILKFDKIVKSKIKRLLIPSIIFSSIYYLLFLDLSDSTVSVIKTITYGAGHMWFLPMLFWCFIAIYILTRISFNDKIIIPLLFIIACLSVVITLPLRINQSLYYLFFFYTGYSVGLHHIQMSKFVSIKWISIALILFGITFPLLSYCRYGIGVLELANKMGGSMPLNIRLLIGYSFQNLCQLIYSIIGVFLIYTSVNYLILKKKIAVTNRIVSISSYCFGVYIFQEFIIRIFYYKLGAISELNPYIFPWLSFAITLIISLILTHYSLKTRIGKFLLG